MLGSRILYLKGMRLMMFQLSGYYCKDPNELGNLKMEGLGFGIRGFF